MVISTVNRCASSPIQIQIVLHNLKCKRCVPASSASLVEGILWLCGIMAITPDCLSGDRSSILRMVASLNPINIGLFLSDFSLVGKRRH